MGGLSHTGRVRRCHRQTQRQTDKPRAEVTNQTDAQADKQNTYLQRKLIAQPMILREADYRIVKKWEHHQIIMVCNTSFVYNLKVTDFKSIMSRGIIDWA